MRLSIVRDALRYEAERITIAFSDDESAVPRAGPRRNGTSILPRLPRDAYTRARREDNVR